MIEFVVGLLFAWLMCSALSFPLMETMKGVFDRVGEGYVQDLPVATAELVKQNDERPHYVAVPHFTAAIGTPAHSQAS